MPGNHTAHEQLAEIRGKVEYRLGDGPKAEIPQGPVQVATTDIDATLSWAEGDTHSVASMPIGEFKRYVAEGAIAMQGQLSR